LFLDKTRPCTNCCEQTWKVTSSTLTSIKHATVDNQVKPSSAKSTNRFCHALHLNVLKNDALTLLPSNGRTLCSPITYSNAPLPVTKRQLRTSAYYRSCERLRAGLRHLRDVTDNDLQPRIVIKTRLTAKILASNMLPNN
jgi:hypothetical protein